jgi:hypothetical protein
MKWIILLGLLWYLYHYETISVLKETEYVHLDKYWVVAVFLWFIAMLVSKKKPPAGWHLEWKRWVPDNFFQHILLLIFCLCIMSAFWSLFVYRSDYQFFYAFGFVLIGVLSMELHVVIRNYRRGML